MRYWKIKKSVFDYNSKTSLEAAIENKMDLWDTIYIYFDGDGDKVEEEPFTKYIVDSILNNLEKDC